MSEKIQHTAASMREKMSSRYGDEIFHKHNKNHTSYRLHCRTHPCNSNTDYEQLVRLNTSTGLVRQFKLQKFRKRLDKGKFH